MVIGASSCGVRALTASSGPGISLKQEGISTLCDEGLPAVVITQVRYGNGLGTLFTSQCDYHRETRGGGRADYLLYRFMSIFHSGICRFNASGI